MTLIIHYFDTVVHTLSRLSGSYRTTWLHGILNISWTCISVIRYRVTVALLDITVRSYIAVGVMVDITY